MDRWTAYNNNNGIPYSIEYPNKYSKYKTDNNVFFSGIDLVLTSISFCGKVEKHKIPKYVRADFTDNNAYLKGQFSEKICVVTTWNNITYLNITPQIIGEVRHLHQPMEKIHREIERNLTAT